MALLFSLVAGLVAVRAQYIIGSNGGDHRILWNAAHVLLSGGNPYAPQSIPFLTLYYPLPAVLVASAFAWLPLSLAATVFVVLSAALLGYAITSDGFDRVPILLSVPFLAAAQFAQTSPFVMAAALLPALAGLIVVKPNLGAALFVWRPSLRTALFAVVVLSVSLAVSPEWPARWLAKVRASPSHHAPWTVGVGAVGLLALVRWRRPEARLLVAMTLIPHALLFYDELPLFLIAQSRREAMALVISSWVGLFAWMATSRGPALLDIQPWSVASVYLPALVIVLRRANVSTDAAGVEVPVAS